MRRLVLVALLAISCGALPAHAQTLTLAYRSGDTFKYAIHSVLKENLAAAGVTISLDIEMTGHERVKVTSWIDAGAHRVVKTHESNSTDVAMTAALNAGTQAMPGLNSAFSVKGAETIDLAPA